MQKQMSSTKASSVRSKLLLRDGNLSGFTLWWVTGKMQLAGCRLCRIVQHARGESTDGLADETHGHIKSAGCEGMTTTVTAAQTRVRYKDPYCPPSSLTYFSTPFYDCWMQPAQHMAPGGYPSGTLRLLPMTCLFTCAPSETPINCLT